MCGRFNIIDDSATRGLMAALGVYMRLATRYYNVAPTDPVRVVVDLGGKRESRDMRW